MKAVKLIAIIPVLAMLYSCEPKPLDIEVKQGPPMLTVSSAALDEHTILVSATYSINSLLGLQDSINGKKKLPPEMLLKSGVVTLSGNGDEIDTLNDLGGGVYGNRNMQLAAGASYTLNIYDRQKGLIGMATTTYFPGPAVEVLQPEVNRNQRDTTVSLKIKLKNVSASDYYFVSYYASSNVRYQAPVTYENFEESIAAYSPRKIFLLSGADMADGRIDKTVQIESKGTDDLLVHVAKIDRAYYDYLVAYKKAGSYINQLTGEPINLPSNVVKGLGFFSLSAPVRVLFHLKDH